MSFWTGNPAAPSFWQTLPFQTRLPGPLRTEAPAPPAPLTLANGSRATAQRLFGTQSAAVSTFLTANYCGPDWCLRDCNWIGNYLRDADVIALGLFVGAGSCAEELVATIFSVPMGEATMSHGGHVRDLRMIEGLCVAPAHRSLGVAGYMIGMMDYVTSRDRPAAHLWCREVPRAGFWDTALRTDIYGYRRCGAADAAGRAVQRMEWDTFIRLWSAASGAWASSVDPVIVAKTPSNRKGRNAVYYSEGCIAVVTDTGRVGRADTAAAERIYEIVWSGRYEGGRLAPASEDLDFKQLLDGIACALPTGGILFATSSPDCGGTKAAWAGDGGWTVGRSGSHAVYIYNYMPPAFGACRILMVRDEI